MMRVHAGWFCASLLSCSPAAQFDSNCGRVFTHVCSHRLDCDQIVDHPKCVRDLEDAFFCDPTTATEAFKVCHDAALDDGLSCNVGMPVECEAVLCDSQKGCDATTGCDPAVSTACVE